jgi:hypothetical protein
LEQEQRAVHAEIERLSRVRQRQAELSEELRQVEARLDALTKRHRRSLLDRTRLASPCNARWAEMQGDERVRFCGQCSKHVYNLSALTSEQAAALVYEMEGDLCVRFFRRADGTLLTSDCPHGARGRRRRRLTVVAAAAAATALGGACATQVLQEPQTPSADVQESVGVYSL